MKHAKKINDAILKMVDTTDDRVRDAQWNIIHPHVETRIRLCFRFKGWQYTDDDVQMITYNTFVFLYETLDLNDPKCTSPYGMMCSHIMFEVKDTRRSKCRRGDWMNHIDTDATLDDATLSPVAPADDVPMHTWRRLRAARDASRQGTRQHEVLTAACDWIARWSAPAGMDEFKDDLDINSLWSDLASTLGREKYDTYAKRIVRKALKDKDEHGRDNSYDHRNNST
jgi:hypothetical protein